MRQSHNATSCTVPETIRRRSVHHDDDGFSGGGHSTEAQDGTRSQNTWVFLLLNDFSSINTDGCGSQYQGRYYPYLNPYHHNGNDNDYDNRDNRNDHRQMVATALEAISR